VCFDFEKCIEFSPCGHQTCEMCLAAWRRQTITKCQQGTTCPFCRGIVNTTQRIASASAGAGAGAPSMNQLSGIRLRQPYKPRHYDHSCNREDVRLMLVLVMVLVGQQSESAFVTILHDQRIAERCCSV
jgi:hypothetical protein